MPILKIEAVEDGGIFRPARDGSARFSVVFRDGDIEFKSLGWRLKDGKVLPPEVQLKSGRFYPTGSLSQAAIRMVKEKLSKYYFPGE